MLINSPSSNDGVVAIDSGGEVSARVLTSFDAELSKPSVSIAVTTKQYANNSLIPSRVISTVPISGFSSLTSVTLIGETVIVSPWRLRPVPS